MTSSDLDGTDRSRTPVATPAEQVARTLWLAVTAALFAVLDPHQAEEVVTDDGERYVMCGACLDEEMPCPTWTVVHEAVAYVLARPR